ncbi:MAG: nucleotide exchange factor GrpE [Methylococcales bacterium]
MDEVIKQQLLSEFYEYIDTDGSAGNEARDPDRTVDLYSLLQEFIALKTEVKIEARQFKSALAQFQSTLDQLSAEKSSLSDLLEQQKAAAQKEKDSALRALLLQLLDLRDRIFEGLKVAESVRFKAFTFCRRKRERAVIEGLRTGQSLTLKRLDQLLASYQVLPIEVLDKAFDPMTMRASELEHRSDVESGRITGELRKGYFWRDQVLRIAEVMVNKVE